MGIMETVANDVANFSGNKHMYGGDITEMTELLKAMVEQVDVTVHNVSRSKAEGEAIKKVSKVSVFGSKSWVPFPNLD